MWTQKLKSLLKGKILSPNMDNSEPNKERKHSVKYELWKSLGGRTGRPSYGSDTGFLDPETGIILLTCHNNQ